MTPVSASWNAAAMSSWWAMLIRWAGCQFISALWTAALLQR